MISKLEKVIAETGIVLVEGMGMCPSHTECRSAMQLLKVVIATSYAILCHEVITLIVFLSGVRDIWEGKSLGGERG